MYFKQVGVFCLGMVLPLLAAAELTKEQIQKIHFDVATTTSQLRKLTEHNLTDYLQSLSADEQQKFLKSLSDAKSFSYINSARLSDWLSKNRSDSGKAVEKPLEE